MTPLWLKSILSDNIRIKQMIRDADSNKYKEVASKLGFPTTRELTHKEIEEIALEIYYNEEKSK